MSLTPTAQQTGAIIEMPDTMSQGQPGGATLSVFKIGPQESSLADTGFRPEYAPIELKSGSLVFTYEADQRQALLQPEHPSSRTPTIQTVIPNLEWLAQDAALTQSIRRLVRLLWGIVVSRALQTRFPLQRTIVSVTYDPAEQQRKVALRLVCNVTAAQAIAFWDSLEPDLQSWLATLKENDRMTFITKVGLRVHWQ